MDGQTHGWPNWERETIYKILYNVILRYLVFKGLFLFSHKWNHYISAVIISNHSKLAITEQFCGPCITTGEIQFPVLFLFFLLIFFNFEFCSIVLISNKIYLMILCVFNLTTSNSRSTFGKGFLLLNILDVHIIDRFAASVFLGRPGIQLLIRNSWFTINFTTDYNSIVESIQLYWLRFISTYFNSIWSISL